MVPKVCFVSSKEKEFDLEMRKIFFCLLKNHAGNHERRELLGPILNYYKVPENLKSCLVISSLMRCLDFKVSLDGFTKRLFIGSLGS